MTDTNKRLRLSPTTGGIGVMRATEQPVTMEMAGRADPQRTTDFQGVLLAMAGHDLSTAIANHPGSHDLSASASGPIRTTSAAEGPAWQSTASMDCSITAGGCFGSMSIKGGKALARRARTAV